MNARRPAELEDADRRVLQGCCWSCGRPSDDPAVRVGLACWGCIDEANVRFRHEIDSDPAIPFPN